jgi:hypothetical protein
LRGDLDAEFSYEEDNFSNAGGGVGFPGKIFSKKRNLSGSGALKWLERVIGLGLDAGRRNSERTFGA